jgi:hypothetical protein
MELEMIKNLFVENKIHTDLEFIVGAREMWLLVKML